MIFIDGRGVEWGWSWISFCFALRNISIQAIKIQMRNKIFTCGTSLSRVNLHCFDCFHGRQTTRDTFFNGGLLSYPHEENQISRTTTTRHQQEHLSKKEKRESFVRSVNMHGWCVWWWKRMARHRSAYVNRRMIEVITRERWHTTRPSITSHQKLWRLLVGEVFVNGYCENNKKGRRRKSFREVYRAGQAIRKSHFVERKTFASDTNELSFPNEDFLLLQPTSSIFFSHRVKLLTCSPTI